MEFWSDWDEDVPIPSPLRIVKCSNAIASCGIRASPRDIHIPRRQSSLSGTAFSSPPQGPVQHLTIHKTRRGRRSVLDQTFGWPLLNADTSQIRQLNSGTHDISGANTFIIRPPHRSGHGEEPTNVDFIDGSVDSDYISPLGKSSWFRHSLFSRPTARSQARGHGGPHANTLQDFINTTHSKSHKTTFGNSFPLTSHQRLSHRHGVSSTSNLDIQEDSKRPARSFSSIAAFQRTFQRISSSRPFIFRRARSLQHPSSHPTSSFKTELSAVTPMYKGNMTHRRNTLAVAMPSDEIVIELREIPAVNQPGVSSTVSLTTSIDHPLAITDNHHLQNAATKSTMDEIVGEPQEVQTVNQTGIPSTVSLTTSMTSCHH